MTDTYIGLLSGTSIDAIDVAAIEFGETVNLTSCLNVEIPKEFKAEYQQLLSTEQISIQKLGELDSWAGYLFAEAVLKLLAHSELRADSISAIGSHGQTIWHSPDGPKPFTIQIGDPNIIAEKTGIRVVSDFRRRDIAAGGQGAPLAPAFHFEVFKSAKEQRSIVNIGGISNVSIIDKQFGYDTGPGNCLIDDWCQEKFNIAYDQNGEIASTGQVNQDLLDHFLQDTYFHKTYPKSSGREYFNLKWIENKVGNLKIANQDILATLTALTAKTIANATRGTQIYLCGGGSHNPEIVKYLNKYTSLKVKTTQALGISPDWVEACLFAWIARNTIEGRPSTIPQITGAKHSSVLGTITS